MVMLVSVKEGRSYVMIGIFGQLDDDIPSFYPPSLQDQGVGRRKKLPLRQYLCMMHDAYAHARKVQGNVVKRQDERVKGGVKSLYVER
jgi:hypothetical protein